LTPIFRRVILLLKRIRRAMPNFPKGVIGDVYHEANLIGFRHFKPLSGIPYFIGNMVKIRLTLKKIGTEWWPQGIIETIPEDDKHPPNSFKISKPLKGNQWSDTIWIGKFYQPSFISLHLTLQYVEETGNFLKPKVNKSPTRPIAEDIRIISRTTFHAWLISIILILVGIGVGICALLNKGV